MRRGHQSFALVVECARPPLACTTARNGASVIPGGAAAGPTLRVVTTAAVPAPPRRLLDRRVVAWAAWDWGGAAFNAVVTTFVFTVYLTSPAYFAPGLQAGTAAYTRAGADLTSRLSVGIGSA